MFCVLVVNPVKLPRTELLAVKDAADNNEEGCFLYRVNQMKDNKNAFIMFEEVSRIYASRGLAVSDKTTCSASTRTWPHWKPTKPLPNSRN